MHLPAKQGRSQESYGGSTPLLSAWRAALTGRQTVLKTVPGSCPVRVRISGSPFMPTWPNLAEASRSEREGCEFESRRRYRAGIAQLVESAVLITASCGVRIPLPVYGL
jgi:hypothetical protein